MGQRLNVEIHREGEIVANAYYHWSAYTRSALEIAQDIIQAYPNYRGKKDIPEEVVAIRLLEVTGARLAPEDLAVANQQFKDYAPFEGDANRNDGLISITEKGMGDTRRWEEGRMILNIDDETVEFQVLSHHFKDEYLDILSCEIEDDEEGLTNEKIEIEFKKIPQYDMNLEEFKFSEIKEKVNFADDLVRQGHYNYRLPDQTVISFYE